MRRPPCAEVVDSVAAVPGEVTSKSFVLIFHIDWGNGMSLPGQ